MKLCIFGSRSCTPSVKEIEAALLVAFVDRLTVSSLICGMAQGADESGYRWAKAHKIPIIERPANWDRHGKAAGHLRNAAMAAECDVALGFWDGISGGTANMAAHLASLGKNFRLVRWNKVTE